MTDRAPQRRPRAARLALKIYLYMTATLVVSVVFLGVTVRIIGPPKADATLARFVVALFVAQRGDPDASRRQAALPGSASQARMSVYDARGALIFSNTNPPQSPLTAAQCKRLLQTETINLSDRRLVAVGLIDKGRLVAYGLFPYMVAVPLPKLHGVILPIGLFCVCLVFTSLLFARSLVKPIGRLTQTAEALGSGDMEARVRLNTRDELGDLGRSFDQMADRIVQLLKSQRELLANVSHELRTPLARIRVSLDIAAEGNHHQAREQLGEIAEDLGEIERLVSDILMAARLDAAGTEATSLRAPPLRYAPFGAVDVAQEAARRFRMRHPERALELELQDELGVIRGDRMLLRRVLDNLLDNAHKYSDKEQPVTLHARSERDGLLLEVADEGPGISEADLPHLFQPFYRADASRSRATGGVGLGLTLCRRIVEAHGGSIDIESGEKRGTIARVWIPESDS